MLDTRDLVSPAPRAISSQIAALNSQSPKRRLLSAVAAHDPAFQLLYGARPLTASSEFRDVVPDPPLLADVVVQGRYRIVRKLGRGGMGAVYEAVDQRLGITVALKETLSAEPSMRKQFEHEARLLASLQHPALPRVTDHFVEGNRAFLVMQFIAGTDLARIIAQQPGPFPRDQVIAWADQLLDALIYLHSHDRQVIHRDIKPHNLKLTATGQIALLDFGLAKAQSSQASDPSITSSQAFFGYTRHYAPLEQIQDQRTDPRTDIYALGATLYHLLTGIKPPDALARAAALANSKSDPLMLANEVHRAVGSEIARILCRAMALSAEDRYADASEFRDALRQVGRGDAPVGSAKPESSIAQSAWDRTVNIKAGRKTLAASFDPFDSYSILKPSATDWLVPKQTRHAAVVAAVLAIVLTAGVAAFYASGHLINSKASLLDFAKATAGNNIGATAAVRQGNADNSRRQAAGTKSISTGSAEMNRRTETQKRRTARPDTSPSKVPDVKPPHFSIAP